MRRLVLMSLLLPAMARAQSPDLATALRANDWPTAQRAAAGMPDPAAAKLVTYFRLQHEGDATPAEIADFINANPDWPNQALLLKRRDQAIADSVDTQSILPLCTATPAAPAPKSGPALARCAQAASDAGRITDAVVFARSAWVAGFADPGASAAFLAQWAGVLTASDQAAKFAALLAAGAPQAAAQLARLAPADQALARARLAIRAGAPDQEALIASLPPAQRNNPGLIQDALRQLEQQDQDDAALALWRRQGFAAEQAAGAPEAATFWALRNRLARDLLRNGDARNAYLLANDTMQVGSEPAADAAFLAGFIALRFLHQPGLAARHFQELAQSEAVISQARAHFWLAEAARAQGDTSGAQAQDQLAAALPTTYYGQLAALASGTDIATLDQRLDALTDPGWTDQQAFDFAGRELTRAAALLVAWGLPERARPFLTQVAVLADDAATRSMDAHFALGLGLPDQAVAAARLAGRYGTMLPQAGWPEPYHPPENDTPAPVALGIMRQESSFDPGAVSRSDALGLMQLLPATARMLGSKSGQSVDVAALTSDAALNMRLGTFYLGQLIARFGGSLPLAIAAYNAGPNRVDQWIAENGDPRGRGQQAMMDWIEEIPYAETRNYVQRVIENIVIYRARAHVALPYPLGV
jgi:soluble lytic murein transglycosylase